LNSSVDSVDSVDRGDDDECPDCPVLDAYRDGVHLMVWCEHERRWHSHGVCAGTCAPRRRNRLASACECPPGAGDGHRVAHCGCPHSPYYADGYRLHEVGPLTPEVERGHGRPWDVCRCCPLQRRAAAGEQVVLGDRCAA